MQQDKVAAKRRKSLIDLGFFARQALRNRVNGEFKAIKDGMNSLPRSDVPGRDMTTFLVFLRQRTLAVAGQQIF